MLVLTACVSFLYSKASGRHLDETPNTARRRRREKKREEEETEEAEEATSGRLAGCAPWTASYSYGGHLCKWRSFVMLILCMLLCRSLRQVFCACLSQVPALCAFARAPRIKRLVWDPDGHLAQPRATALQDMGKWRLARVAAG